MAKKKNLEWRNCSEAELALRVKDWLSTGSLKNSLLFLEGEMGAGKSTFVRELLKVLAPENRSQGSPTFPLVQTYSTSEGPFYHIDLYRLKNEGELRDSGIETQIDEEGATVCVEWASLFPEAFAHWFDDSLPFRKAVYLVRIENANEGRDYTITRFA